MISNLLLKLKGLNEDKFVECIVCQPFTKEELKILQELVDKETPMKVNKQANKEKVYLNDVSYVYEDVVLGECPNCETYLHEENEYGDAINYCPICGQKLDWSEEE